MADRRDIPPDDTSQNAGQIAQQIAEAVSQAARQAAAETSRQIIDATRTAASQEVGAEREFEIGKDESWASHLLNQGQAWFQNGKRTYDEYQGSSLENQRRDRTHVDTMATDSNKHKSQLDQVSLQALQNAVETANMVGKKALENLDTVQKDSRRYADVATDAMWNPIQQGAADTTLIRAVSIDDASLKAIGAVVAAALADAMRPKA